MLDGTVLQSPRALVPAVKLALQRWVGAFIPVLYLRFTIGQNEETTAGFEPVRYEVINRRVVLFGAPLDEG